MDLKYEVSFPYGELMQGNLQNKYRGLMDDLVRLYLTDEKDGADDSMSNNLVTVENLRKRDKRSDTDVWQVYSVDRPIEEN